MSIVTQSEFLDFLGLSESYFKITAVQNGLKLTSDQGGPSIVTLTDGTYDGDDLASHIETVLNADDTLTGSGTITFSVSYSSSTRKFTIDAGSGHTIAYTHSGSSAGYLIGFIKDHSAAQSITSDIAAGEDISVATLLLSEVEAFVSRYCRRTFEETSYSRERYYGREDGVVVLRQYPVTAVDRVAVGTMDVIKITNTDSGTTASAGVTSTGLRLVKGGTEDISVTFASNTTLSAVVAAVNALGSGWSAATLSSDYDDYPSSDLIESPGRYCINSEWVYLQVPDDGESADYDCDYDRGILKLTWGPSSISRCVYVDYTAGYPSDDMPDDLKLAVKILGRVLYQRQQQDSFGLKGYRAGSVSSTLSEADMPAEVRRILGLYRAVRASRR